MDSLVLGRSSRMNIMNIESSEDLSSIAEYFTPAKNVHTMKKKANTSNSRRKFEKKEEVFHREKNKALNSSTSDTNSTEDSETYIEERETKSPFISIPDLNYSTASGTYSITDTLSDDIDEYGRDQMLKSSISKRNTSKVFNMRKKKKKEGYKKPSTILRLDPETKIHIFIHTKQGDTLLKLPVHQILTRESEMKNVAEKQSVSKKLWNGSLIYKSCENVKVIPKTNPSIVISIPENEAINDKKSTNIIQELLYRFYSKGIIYCPDHIIGPDVLHLLEYFQILYLPEAMAFESIHAFLKVRVWGDYYLQRNKMKNWVLHKILSSNQICRAAGFVIAKNTKATYFYKGRKLSILKLPDSLQKMFESSEKEYHDQNDVDSLLRLDFASFIQKELIGTMVWFDYVEVSILPHRSNIESEGVKIVLYIDFYPPKKDYKAIKEKKISKRSHQKEINGGNNKQSKKESKGHQYNTNMDIKDSLHIHTLDAKKMIKQEFHAMVETRREFDCYISNTSDDEEQHLPLTTDSTKIKTQGKLLETREIVYKSQETKISSDDDDDASEKVDLNLDFKSIQKNYENKLQCKENENEILLSDEEEIDELIVENVKDINLRNEKTIEQEKDEDLRVEVQYHNQDEFKENNNISILDSTEVLEHEVLEDENQNGQLVSPPIEVSESYEKVEIEDAEQNKIEMEEQVENNEEMFVEEIDSTIESKEKKKKSFKNTVKAIKNIFKIKSTNKLNQAQQREQVLHQNSSSNLEDDLDNKSLQEAEVEAEAEAEAEVDNVIANEKITDEEPPQMEQNKVVEEVPQSDIVVNDKKINKDIELGQKSSLIEDTTQKEEERKEDIDEIILLEQINNELNEKKGSFSDMVTIEQNDNDEYARNIENELKSVMEIIKAEEDKEFGADCSSKADLEVSTSADFSETVPKASTETDFSKAKVEVLKEANLIEANQGALEEDSGVGEITSDIPEKTKQEVEKQQTRLSYTLTEAQSFINSTASEKIKGEAELLLNMGISDFPKKPIDEAEILQKEEEEEGGNDEEPLQEVDEATSQQEENIKEEKEKEEEKEEENAEENENLSDEEFLEDIELNANSYTLDEMVESSMNEVKLESSKRETNETATKIDTTSNTTNIITTSKYNRNIHQLHQQPSEDSEASLLQGLELVDDGKEGSDNEHKYQNKRKNNNLSELLAKYDEEVLVKAISSLMSVTNGGDISEVDSSTILSSSTASYNYDKNLDFSGLNHRVASAQQPSFYSIDNSQSDTLQRGYTSLHELIYDSLSDVMSKEEVMAKETEQKEESKSEVLQNQQEHEKIKSLMTIEEEKEEQQQQASSIFPTLESKFRPNKWLSEEDVQEFVSFYKYWNSTLPLPNETEAGAKKEEAKIEDSVYNKIQVEGGKMESGNVTWCLNIPSILRIEEEEKKDITEETEACNTSASVSKCKAICAVKDCTSNISSDNAIVAKKEGITSLDSMNADWLWDIYLNNLSCSGNGSEVKLEDEEEKRSRRLKLCHEAYIKNMKEEEKRIEAESVECMRLPVIRDNYGSCSSSSRKKQPLDLDVILEDELKYLMSNKKDSGVEIKYKLLKGKRPPRPQKKLKSKLMKKLGNKVEV